MDIILLRYVTLFFIFLRLKLENRGYKRGKHGSPLPHQYQDQPSSGFTIKNSTKGLSKLNEWYRNA